MIIRLLGLPVNVLKKVFRIREYRRIKDINQRYCIILANTAIQAFLLSASLLPASLKAHRDVYDLKTILAQFLETVKQEVFIRYDQEIAFTTLHYLLLFQQSSYGLSFNSRSKMDLVRVALSVGACKSARASTSDSMAVLMPYQSSIVGTGIKARAAWTEIENQTYSHTDDAVYLIIMHIFLDLKLGEEDEGLEELYLYLKKRFEELVLS